MISTQMIVLAKQPYKEAALLLSGLSPDYGRLNLVANGAQKLSEKKFPAADLFRELEVEFNEEGASDLFTAKQLELAAAFDALADNPKHFQLAGPDRQLSVEECGSGGAAAADLRCAALHSRPALPPGRCAGAVDHGTVCGRHPCDLPL